MKHKVKFDFEGATNDGHAVCDRCGKAIFSTHNQENWFHFHSMNVYCDDLMATPRAGTGHGDMSYKQEASASVVSVG